MAEGVPVGGIDIVWFKRDLRVHDHAPLARAAQTGRPVLCLYAFEPELLHSPEWDPSHAAFIRDCLVELDAALRARGSRLLTRVGDFPQVLGRLARDLSPHTIAHLWSHEETGNALTFERDKRVKRWCAANAIPWTELPNHGVFRPLRSRDGWAARWAKRMNEPEAPAPARIRCISTVAPTLDFGSIPTNPAHSALGLPDSTKTLQPGGETEARRVLEGFLTTRGQNYRADMASPITGWAGCSRLSAHLAWGSVSVRTVHHAQREALARASDLPRGETRKRWVDSLRSFQGRLRWHCHFIQKLEDEPAIEFRNMHRAYDGLRTEDERDWSDDERRRFQAWATGRTGYPFVDACMRALHAESWMNFRMRSMLVSFASHHLWLHWRPTAIFLARHFLDFEPGIHFSQFQMQSGTTGINTVRIYNPIKQGKDQDPAGLFIRRWVPELRHLPAEHIHEPWKHLAPADPGSLFALDDPAPAPPDAGTLGPGSPYPAPIVDHAQAYKLAQQRLFAVRKTAAARAESKRVYLKHGSRRHPTDPTHPPYRGGPEDRNLPDGRDLPKASTRPARAKPDA